MDYKIEMIERLGLIRDAYSQLQEQECTNVSGNPVSVIPVFALQVLYSLGWGGASDLGSIMDSGASSVPSSTAIININFSVEVSGEKKPIAITSTWIQDGDKFKISNVCNGKKMDGQKFSFSSEREKFEGAVRSLKELVNHCILEMV